jgi:uncharacterized repeat protein (TIGR01451 family)
MSSVSQHRLSRRHAVVAAFAFVLVALFATAARAQAAETLYWDNYDATPDSIGFADITGSGGGPLNLGETVFEGSEGMAYDSVTNRLFVANEGGPGNGQITAINLDGSGVAPFSAPGAPVEEPEGVAVDPVTRMIYWVNADTETISYANLNGSGGGVLNLSGATIDNPYRMALDPVAGRVYWINSGANPDTISYANVNNTGGGNLNLTGATPSNGMSGLAADPAGGRLYWVNSNLNSASYARLDGSGGADVDTGTSPFDEPYGVGFDPSLGRLYWGNYGLSEVRTNAIGFANLAGGGGGISPITAPVNGPQDPVVLKSPSGTGAPAVTRAAGAPAALSCSQGSWGADFPGSFVYQAPRSFAYQWTNNGIQIVGATATTLVATAPGSYACVVTAANQAGSASQTSAATVVTASKVKLKTKKKARVQPGGVATFKVTALNQGNLTATKAKVCAKVPKKAKKDLKAPKCKKLGKMTSGGKRTATLKFKLSDSASGTYKVTFQVKGSAGVSAKAKILVTEPKKQKK